MKNLNNEIKTVIRDVLSLSGTNLDVLNLIDGWDIENPNQETLRSLQNYAVKQIDEVKTEIVERRKRLELCSRNKVMVG